MRNDLTGRWGEETAAAYLRRRHYTIVAANYRCRLGEIDLIAENRNYLVFVEVKLRKSAAFAEALEFVERHKQERIRRIPHGAEQAHQVGNVDRMTRRGENGAQQILLQSACLRCFLDTGCPERKKICKNAIEIK